MINASDTSAQVRRCWRASSPGGTASEVEVPGYELAGKTGTAEKADDGGYSETEYVASFVGFAPADDPELARGDGRRAALGALGGAVAAPVFGQIAEFALPYLGIPPGSCPLI